MAQKQDAKEVVLHDLGGILGEVARLEMAIKDEGKQRIVRQAKGTLAYGLKLLEQGLK